MIKKFNLTNREEGNKVSSSVSYFDRDTVEVRFGYFKESQVFRTAITQNPGPLKNLIITELSVFSWGGA